MWENKTAYRRCLQGRQQQGQVHGSDLVKTRSLHQAASAYTQGSGLAVPASFVSDIQLLQCFQHA
jgi:hypothetical protein